MGWAKMGAGAEAGWSNTEMIGVVVRVEGEGVGSNVAVG